MNLFALAGVPREKTHIAVSVHASAGYAALRNEIYRARYGIDNPNLPLLRRLREAGLPVALQDG